MSDSGFALPAALARDDVLVVLGAVGVGLGAAVGVSFASQVLLNEQLETTIDSAVMSALVATLLFLVVESARRALR